MTNLERAKAVSKKMATMFPNTPEAKLMHAIVECALVDSSRVCNNEADRDNKRSAIAYLKGEMIHCEICGVSSEWVHRLINKAMLNFSVRT